MRAWTLPSIAAGSTLALAACVSAPRRTPEPGPRPDAPVVEVMPEQPTLHTHPFVVRTPPRVLTWWIPPHVDPATDQLVGGHTLSREVAPAQWWTERVASGGQRAEPRTVGPMRDEHRRRPTAVMWDAVRRGGIVPYRATEELP